VVNSEFGRHVANHVAEYKLGRVYQGDTGFILARDPDTTLAPDIAFVSSDRVIRTPDHRGFLEQAPDLAVEILSPSQSFRAAQEKMQLYVELGVRMGLLVHSYRRTITAYRPDRATVVLGPDDIFDGDDVLPGFRLKVSDLFIM
jgi:Uma2 family endonuclease